MPHARGCQLSYVDYVRLPIMSIHMLTTCTYEIAQHICLLGVHVK